LEFHGVVAGLQYRAGSEGRVTFARFVRLDPALQQALRSHYATRNPWVRATQPLYQPGTAFATEAAVPLSALRRTGFHADILQPAGVLHGFGACVLKRRDDVLSFTVVRAAAAGGFAPAELGRVRAVLPHLLRVVQVNEHLSDLQHTRTALLDAVERVRSGVFGVDRNGRVVFANRTGRAIVAQDDGLTIVDGGLMASGRADHIALRRLIAGAAAGVAVSSEACGGTMTIGRPSLRRPYTVLVAPVPSLSCIECPRAVASVFVSDPEMERQASGDVLSRLYSLTRTESQLAMALIDTGVLSQAADRLGIGRETARWHLKRIYRKTGTNRQSALIGRVAAAARFAERGFSDRSGSVAPDARS
jgi:DNA-binding CsgD family transcriptional regulator